MILFLSLCAAVFADCQTADPNTLGGVACNLQAVFPSIVQLLIGIAYVSGVGFGVAAIFKLKQVKDNPTQIPISAPFALLAISALLVFLPDLFVPVGATLFGSTGTAGSPNGSTVISGLTE